MTYTIKITDQADNDIRNIYEYIAYELQSPEKASGQLDRIEKCIMSLDDMPGRYRFYDREPWKRSGYGGICQKFQQLFHVQAYDH